MVDTDDIPAPESSVVIRTGRDGRQRYSDSYKSEVLAAFAASGMSGKAFADHCGVKYPTFASWLAKRRRETSAPGPSGSPGPCSTSWVTPQVTVPALPANR